MADIQTAMAYGATTEDILRDFFGLTEEEAAEYMRIWNE